MTKQFPSQFQQLIESLLGEESKNFSSLPDIRPFSTFRFNPLKHTIAFQQELLREQGFQFRELKGLPMVARVDGTGPQIGRSLSHFAGHVYIQNLASMLPVIALNPKPGERVLDMCAAPGSKTTQLAATMQNQGLIIANDVSVKRLKSLTFNLRRMGVQNTAVCKGYGEQYGNLHFETFHRVLVDPPCSALGTLQKSPEVLSWWTPERSEKLSGIQLRLVESGLKALKPGGVLTYSTCTITPAENEEVIDQILRKFPVQLEQINLSGVKSRPGLAQSGGQRYKAELSKTIRLYPWDNQSEAFFVARLRKLDSFGRKNQKDPSDVKPVFPDMDEKGISHLRSLADHYGLPWSIQGACYSTLQQDLYCLSPDLRGFPLSRLFIKAGLPIAHIRGNDTMVTTEGAHLLGHLATRNTVELNNLEELERYVNRESITIPLGDRFQVLVRYLDAAIGHGLSQSGRLLSRFPRTGWRFELQGRQKNLGNH
jgi:16S rRNA (cytosine1407-C5)-methyltransferase